ncbi:hypothetical protein GGR66_001212 [Xanthomonas sp. 3498]|nr:hypothetical protein [Xanthomonas sp. 3498]
MAGETMNGAVKVCAECGCARVRLVIRDRGERARLQCTRCGARGAEATGESAVWFAEYAWAHGRPIRDTSRYGGPAAPVRGGEEAAKGDDRDPLELLARMLVGGGYRVPVEGRGTKGALTSADIAGALAYMKDPLQRATVLAVATRAGDAEVARLADHAFRHVAEHFHTERFGPLSLKLPADRWRLRLVVHAAATELVWPERRRPHGELAKEAKMRKSTYLQAHASALALLQEALSLGRRSFSGKLFQAGFTNSQGLKRIVSVAT